VTELVFAVGVLAAVPAAGELVVYRFKPEPEVARKLVHATSAVLAACLPLLISYRQIAFLGIGFALGMGVLRRVRPLVSLTGVDRDSYGEIWFPLGVGMLAALFPYSACYVYGTLVLGFADTAAALAGSRVPSRRLPFTRGKTVAGTLAFLMVSAAIGAAFTGALSAPALAAAFVLAAAEALASRGTDNAVVPILAGFLAFGGWA
jgi:dolichol kinase